MVVGRRNIFARRSAPPISRFTDQSVREKRCESRARRPEISRSQGARSFVPRFRRAHVCGKGDGFTLCVAASMDRFRQRDEARRNRRQARGVARLFQRRRHSHLRRRYRQDERRNRSRRGDRRRRRSEARTSSDPRPHRAVANIEGNDAGASKRRACCSLSSQRISANNSELLRQRKNRSAFCAQSPRSVQRAGARRSRQRPAPSS